MDRDAIEKLEQMAVDAQAPIVEIPGTTDYFLRQKDGSLEFKRQELLPIAKINCGDLATLIKFITEAEAATRDNIAVYVSQEKIVGVCENKELEQRFVYTLPLPLHPNLVLVQNHRRPQTYDKKGFETLTRAQLAGAINSDIVLAARDIKVTTQAEQENKNAGGGNATMKASLVAQVESNGKKLPDSFVVYTPIFNIEESRIVKREIDMLLDVETSGTEVKFTVTAVHDSLEAAILAEMRDLKNAIIGSITSPVYIASF